MLTAYDEIELFGLTESADDLPIPCDDTLRDAIVRETFETLFAGLIGTGLHREIEPLAYGLASLLHRRRNLVDAELTKHTDTMRGLVRAVDGSEVIGATWRGLAKPRYPVNRADLSATNR